MSKLERGTTAYNIKSAKTSLLLKHPFYGYLLSTMNWIKRDDIPTIATDYENIFYNEEFFNSLEKDERLFACGHELLHCVFQHGLRRNGRDPRLWNVAADYAINDILVKNKVGKMRYNKKTNKPEWLLDDRFSGMSAEEVYKILEEENSEQQDNTLDVHLDPDNFGSNNQDKESQGDDQGKDSSSSKKQKKLSISKRDVDKKAKEFKNKIVQAYQYSKMAGKEPGGLNSVFKDLLEPTIDWKTLLNSSIQSLFKNDRNWSRPNRRNACSNFVLPSMVFDDTVDICVALDTSGSIDEKAKKEFLSEIVGILNFYSDFTLRIWCFDTEVHGYKKFTINNLKELPAYEFSGGGGTDIKCNFDYMQDKDIKPKQLIVFTDGYNCSDNWGPANYCDTVWIFFHNEDPKPPFGRFSIYKRKS